MNEINWKIRSIKEVVTDEALQQQPIPGTVYYIYYIQTYNTYIMHTYRSIEMITSIKRTLQATESATFNNSDCCAMEDHSKPLMNVIIEVELDTTDDDPTTIHPSRIAIPTTTAVSTTVTTKNTVTTTTCRKNELQSCHYHQSLEERQQHRILTVFRRSRNNTNNKNKNNDATNTWRRSRQSKLLLQPHNHVVSCCSSTCRIIRSHDITTSILRYCYAIVIVTIMATLLLLFDTANLQCTVSSPRQNYYYYCQALSSSSSSSSKPPSTTLPWQDRTLKVAFVTGNAMKVRKRYDFLEFNHQHP